MNIVKYALIGFGGIAENRIAKEGFACDKARFHDVPAEYELIGACDVNPERRSAAEALGLEWYADSRALLADPRVDAVDERPVAQSRAYVAGQPGGRVV